MVYLLTPGCSDWISFPDFRLVESARNRGESFLSESPELAAAGYLCEPLLVESQCTAGFVDILIFILLDPIGLCFKNHFGDFPRVTMVFMIMVSLFIINYSSQNSATQSYEPGGWGMYKLAVYIYLSICKYVHGTMHATNLACIYVCMSAFLHLGVS